MRRYGEDYTLTQDDLDVIATYMNADLIECLYTDLLHNTPEDFLRDYVSVVPYFKNILKMEFSIEL